MTRTLLSALCIFVVVAGCQPRGANPPAPAPAPVAPQAAPAPGPSAEQALLDRIRNENRDLHFARPAPATFPWYAETGGERSISGWELNAPVRVGNDYTALNRSMQSLGDFLMGQGFARDMYNSTEIVDGYKKAGTVASIRSTCPEEGTGDCILTVRMGRLPTK